MTWTPEDDQPIPYSLALPQRLTWPEGRARYAVPLGYIEDGLCDAEAYLIDAVEDYTPAWGLIEAWANDPAARQRIGEQFLSLDDRGRWRCPAGTWHQVDDDCTCKKEGTQ